MFSKINLMLPSARRGAHMAVFAAILLGVSGAKTYAAEPAVAVDGAAVYAENCAVCHGDRGDGMTRARRGLNPPPRDFTTAVAAAELTRERMIDSITHGREGTAMMAFATRLSGQQIAAVADYVREKFMMREVGAVDDETRRLSRGELIYVSNCAVCHGDDGNGAMWTKTSLNPPPRDFVASAADELTRERMITSVTHGRPGTAMMSFANRLGEDEIAAVVDYVRQAFLAKDQAVAQSPHGMPRAHPPLPSEAPQQIVDADMSLAFPHGLAGDVDQGRAFYMSNCFTCHGEAGDGSGPRSTFIQPPPRNFLAEASRRTLNRPALFAAISQGKRGTVMPAWRTVLSEQEIANVAEFVFQTFIRGDAIGQDESAAGPQTDKKKHNG